MTCCNSDTTNTAIEQAVDDALAERVEELSGYATDAKKSAIDAAASAQSSEASNQSAEGYRDQTQQIFNSAQELVPQIGQISSQLQNTADIVNNLAGTVSSYLIQNYFYSVIGGEQTITLPDQYKALAVQAMYIEGVRQESGRGFVFDSNTQVITLAEPLPVEAAGEAITIQVGVTNADSPEMMLSILAGDGGAGLIGTASGESLQAVLNTILAKFAQWDLNNS